MPMTADDESDRSINRLIARTAWPVGCLLRSCSHDATSKLLIHLPFRAASPRRRRRRRNRIQYCTTAVARYKTGPPVAFSLAIPSQMNRIEPRVIIRRSLRFVRLLLLVAVLAVFVLLDSGSSLLGRSCSVHGLTISSLVFFGGAGIRQDAGDGALRTVKRLAGRVASQQQPSTTVSATTIRNSSRNNNRYDEAKEETQKQKKKKKKLDGVGGTVFDTDEKRIYSSSSSFSSSSSSSPTQSSSSTTTRILGLQKRTKESQVWDALSTLESDSTS